MDLFHPTGSRQGHDVQRDLSRAPKGTHEFSSPDFERHQSAYRDASLSPALPIRPSAIPTIRATAIWRLCRSALRRNLSTGLLISANYQYSHGISDGSNGDGESDSLQNNNCRSCERGNADFDVRHNFTTSVIWMVPVGKGHSCWETRPA